MRHHNANRKFGRERDQREAFIQSLVLSLLHKEKITTTLARAKELRPIVEKIVTRSRTTTVANKRLIRQVLGSNDTHIVKKLFETIGPRYVDRAGGYMRITKLPQRKSDAAPMASIEFV